MSEYIELWNVNSARFHKDIMAEAENILSLETKLVSARGAIGELKRLYIESLLNEKEMKWFRHHKYKAMVYDELCVLTDITVRTGECYLIFNPLLKSGRVSKTGYSVNCMTFDNIKWITEV